VVAAADDAVVEGAEVLEVVADDAPDDGVADAGAEDVAAEDVAAEDAGADDVGALEVADGVGADTVMVTPASAQNFSRSPGRAAISAALHAFCAQGVTIGVRVVEALQTHGKSVAWQPVEGTAWRMQDKAQLGRSDRFWA